MPQICLNLADCQEKWQPVFSQGSQFPHEVWLTFDENCRRSSALKFPVPYGPVFTKFSKGHKCLSFGRSPKKLITCIRPWLPWFPSSLVEIECKLWEQWPFENLNNVNFAKCTEWPQSELKWPDPKSTPHMDFLGLRVQTFHPFHSTISRFQDIPHFMISHWLSC